MKKIILGLLVIGATVVYADNQYEELEKKIELQLLKEMKTPSKDYEVDIYEDNGANSAEVKLEISDVQAKMKSDYDAEAKSVFEILRKNGIKGKSFFVESDTEESEDEIIYQKIEGK